MNTNLEYKAKLNIILAVKYLNHLGVLLGEIPLVGLVHRHKVQVWHESVGCGSEGGV